MVEYLVGTAAFLIACRILKLNEASIKGAIGELKLASKLKHLKIPGHVKVFRDTLIPADWGTSQIDAIAVTRYGILVLEMKNYNAKIFGSVDAPDWKAVYEGDHKHTLPSPIQQNSSHVLALKHLLQYQYPHLNYLPLVVFSNQATLHIQNSRNKVCHLKDVNKVIQRQLGEPILTDKQVDEISSIIDVNRLRGRRARKNHVTAIDLRREAEQTYSAEYMARVEAHLRAQASQKPIYSSHGIIQTEPERASNMDDTRPLYEILKGAQMRTNQSKTETNTQNHSHLR